MDNPVTPSQRSPRRGRRDHSTATAEKRARSVGHGSQAPSRSPRKKISELSDEERKEYFRARKQLSRQRAKEQPGWVCDHPTARVEAQARRYSQCSPRMFLVADWPDGSGGLGLSAYTGKRFSHVVMSLDDVVRYKLLPNNPILMYFGYEPLLEEYHPTWILTHSPPPENVRAIVTQHASKWLDPSLKRIIKKSRSDLLFLGQVPVRICRGDECAIEVDVYDNALLCAHRFQNTGGAFYIPCIDCGAPHLHGDRERRTDNTIE